MLKSRLQVPPTSNDHHLGDLTAPLVLVEYGDFECPFCAQAYPVFEQLIKDFAGVCFIYRHFPLKQIHPHADLAARAAEAADEQGQFWQMHHLLFENFDRLSTTAIVEFANSLNLSLEQFSKDWKREDLAERVHRDFVGGVKSGVNGTPCVFVNGERFDRPIENLRPVLASALRKTG